MKKIFGFLARPIVWSTLGLVVLLLALWVICGLLKLDEQAYLVELLVGTPLGIFLFAYWIRRFLADRRLTKDLATQARKQAAVAGPDALRDFAALEEEFQRAFRELHETCRKRGLVGGAAALPWIMVMGPPNVGKTTALDRSGLRFTQRRMQGIGPTKNCTWWLASDAVFLDTAGRYAVREEDQQEWAAFLRLLKRRRKQPIDAVVLQVGFDELLDRSPTDIERRAIQLRERLDELTRSLGVQIPVHLLFNKVDLLDGFPEFFADLTEAERERAWGFNLDAALHAQPGQAVGPILDEKWGELVAVLTKRQTARLLVQNSREAREAALEFPAQVATLQAPLRRFIEVLADAQRGEERPRLAAVYLASAVQSGDRRPGARHRLASELGLSTATRLTAVPPCEDSSFLRGVFAQVIRHAENAVRPTAQRLRRMVLEQRAAIGLSMLACLGVCFVLGGRYRADRRWMEQLADAVRELRGSTAPDAAARKTPDSKILRELAAQHKVLNLLDERPHGAIGRPHRAAREILLQRIDASWLLPLQAQLKQDLATATTAQYDKPGAEFDRGFQLLKAAHILDGESCAPVTAEETQQAISDFILAQWRRALGSDRHVLDVREEADSERPEHAAGRLQRSLLYFFEQEPAAYAKMNSLRLDHRQRLTARDNLRSANAQATVVFMLRASNANLYTKMPQLRGSYVSDPGIEQVFTRTGCARFFDKKTASGKHWWKCVLDVEEPKDPINLEEEYRQRYLEAWGGWLSGLTLKPGAKDAKSDALGRAEETLSGLLRPPRPELTQMVELAGVGREESLVPRSLRRVRQSGCAGWLRKQATKANKEYRELDTPESCKQALLAFEPFVQLTAKPSKDKEDEDSAGNFGDLFRKYLTAAAALRTTLYDSRNMTPNNRGKRALKLVSDTMGAAGELWAVDEARRSVIGELDGRMRPSNIAIADSGLHQILLQVERDAWSAMLPPAAKAIDDRWRTEVFEEWTKLKEKHARYTAQDPERVKDIVDFGKKVKEFSKQALAPIYQNNDPSKCVLATMSPPFTDALPLSREACVTLQKFIRVAEITDPNKALGGAGSAPKRPPLTADVSMGGCVGYNARAVQLDDSEILHTCFINSTRCQHEPSVNKRPSLSVSWGENTSFRRYLQGDDYALFIKNMGAVDGNHLTFTLPAGESPGQCAGIKVKFELQPAQGGGGAPSKPDNAWKEITLPPSLLAR